jgi:hypothetical protein
MKFSTLCISALALTMSFVSSQIAAQSEITLTSKEKALIQHVKDSIANAEKGVSKITPEILNINGMSSAKVRHFLNNLCSKPNTNYLEIGCWRGSTLVSALYGNKKTVLSAVAIDNWTLGGSDEFFRNIDKYLSDVNLVAYSNDCFDIVVDEIVKNPVDIYFYDGEHKEIDHEKAFTYYTTVLDDVFIAIVDDYNWIDTQTGTKKAFEKLNYKVLYENHLPAAHNGDREQWWNGLYVAVIRK